MVLHVKFEFHSNQDTLTYFTAKNRSKSFICIHGLKNHIEASDLVHTIILWVSWSLLIFIMVGQFLAATKQLYKWYFPSVRPSVRLSVCPSVCLSHLFDYVPIIVSSWNFQELLPMTKVRSMQKVKVRGQRSRSQRSQPNLTVSGL